MCESNEERKEGWRERTIHSLFPARLKQQQQADSSKKETGSGVVGRQLQSRLVGGQLGSLAIVKVDSVDLIHSYLVQLGYSHCSID